MRQKLLLPLSLILALLPAVASAQQVDSAEVRALVRAGNTAWQAADFKKAIVAWSDAWALTGEPELLYRIGQAHEQQGNFTRAREYTEAYLEAVGQTPYEAAIRAHIAELTKQERTQQARLEVRSIPAGAIIRIDGMEETQRAPATIPVAAGAVIVEVEHPDYPGVLRAEVVTAPGATVRHDAKFLKIKETKAEPKVEPKVEPTPEKKPEQTPTPTPPVEDEGELTIVDIRPPTGVYIVGWGGLVVGSALFIVGGLIDYADYGNDYTLFWVGGLAAASLGGYLMFGYDWSGDLPRISASPQHAVPVARTLNLTLSW
jgi:hypothetical protein